MIGTDNKTFQGRLLAAAYTGPDWCMAEKTIEKLGLGGELTGEIWIDCRKEDTDVVDKALNQLLDGIGHIEMETYADALELSEMSMRVLKAGVYAFLKWIGIAAFMNLANTLITTFSGWKFNQ